MKYKNSNGDWITISNVTETKNYTLANQQVLSINGETWSTSYTGVAPASFFQTNDNITDAVAIEITLNAMNSRNHNFTYCVGLIEAEIFQ